MKHSIHDSELQQQRVLYEIQRMREEGASEKYIHTFIKLTFCECITHDWDIKELINE